MVAPTKWRLRFGLGTLLAIVLMCAVVARIYVGVTTPREVLAVKHGMSLDEVRAILGEPSEIDRSEYWPVYNYRYHWGALKLCFGGRDSCFWILCVAHDNKQYRVSREGRLVEVGRVPSRSWWLK